MSTWIMSEAAVMVSSQDKDMDMELSTSSDANNGSVSAAEIEIESAKCDCCSLTEECTPAYIDRVRQRYGGKWICGLCSEAVKDEIVRSAGSHRLLTTDEALSLHLNVCRNFRSSSPPATDPTVHLITAIRHIIRRSLDSPRGTRSTPASPVRRAAADNEETMKTAVLMRSGSCFPTRSV